MKILHTSDWHLGHRLLEQSQLEEQTLFLDWLIDYIDVHGIDLLLLSGDLFDVGVPSTQAQKLYYDFLIRLHGTCCKEVIITGGNHDAPGTVNAPKELLNALSIRVVGKASGSIDEEIFTVTVGDEQVIVAAVPYLRDQDIRRAVAAESSEEIVNRYKTALVNHFREAAACCEAKKREGTTVIAMGHLFAIGGCTSESEQSIYVGNLGDIGADDFPAVFDYVALGHLHRTQQVGGKEYIRYSGSPYPLSFSEAGQEKNIIELETGESLTITNRTVPAFRQIVQIAGSVAECKAQLSLLAAGTHSLIPWAEVILKNREEAITGYKEIQDYAKELALELLKVTVLEERRYDHLQSLVDQAQQIKTLNPTEVFRLKCKEQQIDLHTQPEMLDAFNEILQSVIEKE
ncbi:MAG: sbcD [Bacteroidetes bacterium]|nr:sbcD [Bacteroidota bacterium]